MKTKTVCVFCGSRAGTRDSLYREATSKVAELISINKWNLVYGGASVGLMGTIADGCLKMGRAVIGVLPENFDTVEVAHQNLTQLIKVGSMHERKFKMYELSDSFLVLPGGLGTMDEFFEILTWKQIGFHNKPIAIWNFNSYYDSLIQFLDSTQEQGFVSGLNSLVFVSSNLEEVFQNL